MQAGERAVLCAQVQACVHTALRLTSPPQPHCSPVQASTFMFLLGPLPRPSARLTLSVTIHGLSTRQPAWPSAPESGGHSSAQTHSDVPPHSGHTPWP